MTAKLLACAFPEEIPSGAVRVCANPSQAVLVIAQEKQTDEVFQCRNLRDKSALIDCKQNRLWSQYSQAPDCFYCRRFTSPCFL